MQRPAKASTHTPPPRSSGAGKVLLSCLKLEQGSQVFTAWCRSDVEYIWKEAWVWVRHLVDAISKESWRHRVYHCLVRSFSFFFFLPACMCSLQHIPNRHFYADEESICIPQFFNISLDISFWVKIPVRVQFASCPYCCIPVSPKTKSTYMVDVQKTDLGNQNGIQSDLWDLPHSGASWKWLLPYLWWLFVKELPRLSLK